MAPLPIIPRSRKFSVYAAVALLLVMAAVLLAAGCLGEDYAPNRDIIVIKLSSNGSLEWSKIIDHGGDDKASMIIPTSDGGVIVPANYDDLIRLSKDGTIEWESGCAGDLLIQLKDGSVITGSSTTGLFCNIDTNGNLIWNQTLKNNESAVISSIYSAIETNEGVFLVAGNYLAKLDQEGRITWQRSYVTEGHRFFSVIEMKKNEDLLGLSEKNDQLYLIHLDRNGTIIANSSIGTYEVYPSPSIRAQQKGYSVLFFDMTNSTMERVHLDADGNVVDQKTLKNATIPTIIANDEGYLTGALRYTDKPWNNPAGSRTALVGIKKFDPNGIEMWTMTPATFCKPESMPNFDIMAIVQTSDGGYAILGSRDNFWKC